MLCNDCSVLISRVCVCGVCGVCVCVSVCVCVLQGYTELWGRTAVCVTM